jgi:hypothetical protein
MFVRWKRRRRAGTSKTSQRRNKNWGDILAAYIVKNTREGARIRQQVVCYLGSVDEKLIGLPHIRTCFWKHAAPRLDGLKLTKPQRTAIEIKISGVGPRIENNRGG